MIQRFVDAADFVRQALSSVIPKNLNQLLDHLENLFRLDTKPELISGEALVDVVGKNLRGPQSSTILKKRAQFQVLNYFLQNSRREKTIANPEQELQAETFNDSTGLAWQKLEFTGLGRENFQGLALTKSYELGPFRVLTELHTHKPDSDIQTAHKLVEETFKRTLRKIPLNKSFKIYFNSNGLPKLPYPKLKLAWLESCHTKDFLRRIIKNSSNIACKFKTAIDDHNLFCAFGASNRLSRLINLYLADYGYIWDSNSPNKILELDREGKYYDPGLDDLKRADGSFDLDALAERAFEYFTDAVQDDPEKLLNKIFGPMYKEHFMNNQVLNDFEKNLKYTFSGRPELAIDGVSFALVVDYKDYFTLLNCGTCASVPIDRDQESTKTLAEEAHRKLLNAREQRSYIRINPIANRKNSQFRIVSKRDTLAVLSINDTCLGKNNFYEEVVQPYHDHAYEKFRGQKLIARALENGNQNSDQAIIILERDSQNGDRRDSQQPKDSKPSGLPLNKTPPVLVA